jgi:hypothetical protein
MTTSNPEEVQEMHEESEPVSHDPSLLPVSFTVSLFAVLVAMVTVLAHRAHTRSVLDQVRATDSWAEYQAVDTRRHTYEVFDQYIEASASKDSSAAARAASDRFRQQAQQYDDRRHQLRQQAEEFETEVRQEEFRANRFDFGEALLEMGLVITSITLMTYHRYFWYLGGAIGIAGVAVALTGLLIHIGAR